MAPFLNFALFVFSEMPGNSSSLREKFGGRFECRECRECREINNNILP